jgi:hypothetical protein
VSYNSTILAETSLVSYWKLDETAGSTSAADSKGSRTLSTAGSVTFGGTGVSLTCCAFSGNFSSSDFLTGSNAGLPTGTGPVSLECWFSTTSTPFPWNDMCGWGNNATSNSFWLGIRDDGTTIYVTCYSTTVSYTNSVSLKNGAWHHLAATYDGTIMLLYLDGNQVASSTFTLSLTSGIYPFTIGMGYPGNGKFAGSMDEVAVYNAALSSSSILNHYQVGINPPIARSRRICGSRVGSRQIIQ